MKKDKDYIPSCNGGIEERAEDKYASTLPTGAVVVIAVVAAILLLICLLTMFRGCAIGP